MYRPAHFAEDRVEILQALMRAHPFVTLASRADGELVADHLPLQLSPDGRRLLGHVARANPLWKMAAGQEVLAVFQGPQAYVSPSWYATKREHGVSGISGVEWDAVELPSQFMENFCWEWDVVREMTAHAETGEPLPKALFDKMLAAIVGIEITITTLAGKWKVSQNQPAANRAGIIVGLRQRGTDVGDAMAALVAAVPGEPSRDG